MIALSRDPTTVKTPQRKESVACIIIGRNHGHYLTECLSSVFSQTRIPDEILYLDDASEDGSCEVAAPWVPMGLKIIRHDKRAGMCAMRNEGVDKTQAEFLLFVDSDNRLPENYVETMLADMGDNDLVYPSKRFFGEGERFAERMRRAPSGLWTPREHDRRALWHQNYVDTCSMVRRDALYAVGGWHENAVDTLTDWDLALRISGRGSIARSRAVLGYRVHDGNWSEKDRGKSKAQLAAEVRRFAASVTVACVWSGRVPELWGKWLAAVRRALIVGDKSAELIIVDDSPDGFPGLACDQDFTAVHVRRVHRGTDCIARRKDRRGTAEFLAAACNDIMRLASGDVVWFIEDDIVVPGIACHDMLKALLQGPKPLAAVGGFYRSRHGPERYVASHVGDRVNYVTELPKEPIRVHFTGTGCLMVLRDMVGPARFGIEWHHAQMHSSGHDWVFAWRLFQDGQPVLMLPSVVCKHYQTEADWV